MVTNWLILLGQLPVAVDLNDDAQAVLTSNIHAKAATVAMFPEDGVLIDSKNFGPRSNASESQSPENSPRAKASKPKGKTKAADPNARLQQVKSPTDERNVWIYGSALKSIDLAAASRAAAAAHAAASSIQLVNDSVGDQDATLITVRLPDSQSTTFRAMRSACLTEIHAATAAAFSIESEFVFSLSYPQKLLLQQNVSLDELGLIPKGLLLVIFSDEHDTVRKPAEQSTVKAKGVGLPNILELELKEQQSITKSVQSHIIAHHPKVANLIADASSAKQKPARSATAATVDDASVLLASVDGLFLKTNVELQTIGNTRQPDMPREAMKKMVRIESAHEQRHLDREQEKQQYQQHVKRLDSINAGATCREPCSWCLSCPRPSFLILRLQVYRVSLFIEPLLLSCTRLKIELFFPMKLL